MKKPNFFIIGANKCGTTALSEYLRLHPNVFFSTPKEIGFWDDEEKNKDPIALANYLNYFQGATEAHQAIGEGTPSYFRSTEAIRRILAFNPTARFILMIRNPVERFFSWHSNLFYCCRECIQDPEKAWRMQERRKHMNYNIKEKSQLMYGEFCRIASSIKDLLEIQKINKKNIHFIIYDDFKTDTRNEYEKVLAFLKLPSDGRVQFPKIHSNVEVKKIKLNKFMYHMHLRLKNIFYKHWQWFLIKMLRKACRFIWVKLCFKTTSRKKPNELFIKELKLYFREDILELSKILNCDLSSWFK
jgi:hypothetical protein